MARPHVMTIAGSDSGGGAGIQADLKTFAAWECYGSSVITGLTAQNTLGVQNVHEVPADFVIEQLRAVWEDEPPKAIKLGMLTSAETIRKVADFLAQETQKAGTDLTVVLDPVMVSTSGHSLIPEDAIEAIKDVLVPAVQWLTPNIPEAQKLSGSQGEITSLVEMVDLGMKLVDQFGIEQLLLKGGHFSAQRAEVLDIQAKGSVGWKGHPARSSEVPVKVRWEEGDANGDGVEVFEGYRQHKGVQHGGDLAVDMLFEDKGQRLTLFVGPKIDTKSTHGTGCTLSAALASASALHQSSGAVAVNKAELCAQAIGYVKAAIAGASPFGKGNGPLHHGVLSFRRALPPPSASNPHPFLSHLIQSNLPLWNSYVKHPFVVQLGQGTLPREAFEHYIKQDYHYLRHYARAHALGAFKCSTFEEIEAFTDIAKHIARESEMHVGFCQQFGVSREKLLATPEASACAAYARYILDVGAQGDVLDLYMAVASCLVGYGEVGLWLRKRVAMGEAKIEGNTYAKWINDYSGEDFLAAVNRGIENLERRVAQDPPTPERLARLTAIWHECVRLERDFWEMGMKQLW